jgi:flagellar biosynthetic protein FliO
MALTQQILMVLAVFGLLGGMLWLMKRRGALAFSPRRSSARRLEVLERVPLTPHHALHLVRIAGKVVVIGTAPSACTLLDQSHFENLAQQDLLQASQ